MVCGGTGGGMSREKWHDPFSIYQHFIYNGLNTPLQPVSLVDTSWYVVMLKASRSLHGKLPCYGYLYLHSDLFYRIFPLFLLV